MMNLLVAQNLSEYNFINMDLLLHSVRSLSEFFLGLEHGFSKVW